MNEKSTVVNWLRGIAGAIGGAVLGYFLFGWLLRQGLYAMVLPGAMLGVGCGWLSGIRSRPLGILCGVAALLLGLFCEWQYLPFVADKSLGFFLTHLLDLTPMTLIMIAAGGLCGYWFGIRRSNQPGSGGDGDR